MIHVYLLNEGSRAAAYGIGTYVRQMMECLQGLETVTLHVVNLSSDEKESVVKNEDGLKCSMFLPSHRFFPDTTNDISGMPGS